MQSPSIYKEGPNFSIFPIPRRLYYDTLCLILKVLVSYPLLLGFKLLRGAFRVFLIIYLNLQELFVNHCTRNNHSSEQASWKEKKKKPKVNTIFGKNQLSTER